jgi:hypothetical protein
MWLSHAAYPSGRNMYIRCPVTGEAVSTGWACTSKEFEELESYRNVVRCPHCGDIHRYCEDDLFLESIAEEAPGESYHQQGS